MVCTNRAVSETPSKPALDCMVLEVGKNVFRDISSYEGRVFDWVDGDLIGESKVLIEASMKEDFCDKLAASSVNRGS